MKHINVGDVIPVYELKVRDPFYGYAKGAQVIQDVHATSAHPDLIHCRVEVHGMLMPLAFYTKELKPIGALKIKKLK